MASVLRSVRPNAMEAVRAHDRGADVLPAMRARTIFSTTSALMAFPRASNATVLALGKMLELMQALEAGAFAGCRIRRSQAMIGTWVLVIAISDGELVGRLTRTPDARNWMTYSQISRG